MTQFPLNLIANKTLPNNSNVAQSFLKPCGFDVRPFSIFQNFIQQGIELIQVCKNIYLTMVITLSYTSMELLAQYGKLANIWLTFDDQISVKKKQKFCCKKTMKKT